MMLRTGAHELSISALRLQIPAPHPTIVTYRLLHATGKNPTISLKILGFGRVYGRPKLPSKSRPFVSKSYLSQQAEHFFEGFSGDCNTKRNNLLYTARAATVGLQENWADVEDNSDGSQHTDEDRDVLSPGLAKNGGKTENSQGGPQTKQNVNGNIEQQYDVKELEEYSEEWRRRKIAWLCKELPAHDPAPMIKMLNKQRKWIQPEDAKYIVIHLLRIRENSTSHRVYKWMIQQQWYEFDLVIATKLADMLAKDLKVARCRDIFDEIINRGHVPCESTFIMLIMAYIEAPVQGSIDEACEIYNRMIQLGGYKPSLSLQNSLFKALLSGTGGTAKYYLSQAEAVFQNMKTAGYRINKDIYAGLIWLHSYQDCINHERIASLRKELQQAGLDESRDLLISILRVCSKYGDVDEAERAWAKLLESGFDLTSQVFVYRIGTYAKAGEPMKSLEILEQMHEKRVPMSVVVYQKIIEVMANAREKAHAENFMKQYEDSGMKSLQSSYVDLMRMYLDLNMYDEVDSTFSRCVARCQPNRLAYNIYLQSLIKCGRLERAEEIFAGLQKDGAIGANPQAWNIMLEGYLTGGQEAKIQQLYDDMCRKKYEVEPTLMQRIQPFISSGKVDIKEHLSLKLIPEQREILIGMLLSGAWIESHAENKTYKVHFEFNQKIGFQNILNTHLHERFFEWLKPMDRLSVEDEEIPYRFSTVSHSCFRFYADQFRPEGQAAIPRLIHRWLSPRVLAYWYMYGGRKSSSGDIVLNAQSRTAEEVELIMKALKTKSINCSTKRRGKHFQVRFQGKNAMWLWKLMEPYILDNLKEVLKPEDRVVEDGADIKDTGSDSENEFNEEKSEFNNDSNSQEGIKKAEMQSRIFS